MTGVQDSSIGMDFAAVHQRFVTKVPHRFRPATGHATVCALAVTAEGGKAKSVRRIQWSPDGTRFQHPKGGA